MGWLDLALKAASAYKKYQPAVEGASALGGTLGAMASARGEGRAAQAAANDERDKVRLAAQTGHQTALSNQAQLKERAQEAAGDLDLKQKQFKIDSQGANLSNAMRGGLIANAQDFHFNRPPGVPGGGSTGGARVSAMGAATRQAGSEVERQALMSIMNPDKMAALPTGDMTVQNEMQMQQAPQENILDKILGAAGTVGGISTGVVNAQDAIRKIMAQKLARGQAPQMAQAPLTQMPGQNVGIPGPPPAPYVGNTTPKLYGNNY